VAELYSLCYTLRHPYRGIGRFVKFFIMKQLHVQNIRSLKIVLFFYETAVTK